MAAKKPVTMSIGEVLWDMLPDGKVLGGAPTNVAWHSAQLGADAHVASAVGRDALGDEIIERLKAMRLDLSAVATIDDKPTSTVDAKLGPDGSATYVIRENVAWDAMPASPEALALAAKADGVNFGTLAQRGGFGRESTHAILDATRLDCLRVFDVNLRTPFIYKDVLDGGLAKATVVKMNDDELPVIAGLFGWRGEPEAAMTDLFEAYPNLRHIVVTRGGRGAWWHDRKRLFGKPPATKVKVVDTIGAGDAFTASVMLGLLKGWDEETIMDAALAVAAFVCSNRGGTPELPDDLKAPFLR